MASDCTVRTRYRLTVRRVGPSRVRRILEAGPGTLRILTGRITPDDAVLDVEVHSLPEELPDIESALARHAELARLQTA